MRSYLNPVKKIVIIMGVLFLVLTVGFVFGIRMDARSSGSSGLSTGNKIGLIVSMILFFAVTVGVIGAAGNRYIGLKEKLEQLRGEGRLQDVEDDFDAAKPMLCDSIRLGSQYLFPKEKGFFTAYSDISALYLRKNYNARTSRMELGAVIGEKQVTLCWVPPLCYERGDLEETVHAIRAANPSIDFQGYN